MQANIAKLQQCCIFCYRLHCTVAPAVTDHVGTYVIILLQLIHVFPDRRLSEGIIIVEDS